MHSKGSRIGFCSLAGTLSLYLFTGVIAHAASVDNKTQPKLSNTSTPTVKVPTQLRQLTNYDPIWETSEISPSPQIANVEAPTQNVRPKANINLPPRHVQSKSNIQTPVKDVRPATNVKLPARPRFQPQDSVRSLQKRPLYQPQVRPKLKTQTSTLNSKFEKELLYREYPTDSRGSGMRDFFRPRSNPQVPSTDSQPGIASGYVRGTASQQNIPANRATADECGKPSRSRTLSRDWKKCAE